MLNFIFKVCNSDNNYINKTFTDGQTFNGVIKDDCSIENPILKIKASPSILTYNYVVIPAYGRSYFVKDVVVRENGYYDIYCEVDVLETYKNVILNNPCIIESSEQTGIDNYIRHECFVSTVKHKTDIIKFPSGLNDSGEFILITAGG